MRVVSMSLALSGNAPTFQYIWRFPDVTSYFWKNYSICAIVHHPKINRNTKMANGTIYRLSLKTQVRLDQPYPSTWRQQDRTPSLGTESSGKSARWSTNMSVPSSYHLTYLTFTKTLCWRIHNEMPINVLLFKMRFFNIYYFWYDENALIILLKYIFYAYFRLSGYEYISQRTHRKMLSYLSTGACLTNYLSHPSVFFVGVGSSVLERCGVIICNG